jgi:hypothetical protein
MATSVTNTTSYAGEYKKEIISAALLSAPTLDNGLVEVKPNIKDKRIVKRAALGTLIGSSTCAFNADSSITLDERVLEIAQLQVNLEVCKADFEDDYFALEMGDSAHMNMPASFTDFLLAETAAKVASEMEVLIWQATTAGAVNDFDGFLTLFAADVTVVDVTPGILTIVEELQSIVDAIPVTILRKDDLFIYVANDIYQKYITALGGFGAAGLGANGYKGEGTNQSFGALMFGGIKIVPVDGFPAGEAVAARKSNLWFGTSLLADWQETKVLDMADLDGSRNIRVIMRMGAGVQYGYGAEVVYYHA